jgi:hypothetical protein
MNAQKADQKYLDYVIHLLNLFHSLSRDLVWSIDKLLPLLEALRLFVQSLPDDDLESSFELKAAYENIRRFTRGSILIRKDMPWMRFADIRNVKQPLAEPDPVSLQSLKNNSVSPDLANTPPEAYKAVDQDLCAQLLAIRESAVAFWTTQEKFRQLVHENNLVRPGADLHSFILKQLEWGRLRYYLDLIQLEQPDADELYVALAEFCGVYRSLLAAFDLLAQLRKPEQNDFEECFKYNENLIRRARAASKDEEDYNNIFKHLRHQLEMGETE